MNTNYLNEQKYQKSKKKLSTIALIIFLASLALGIFLISIGLEKKKKNDTKYSEENIQNQIDEINKKIEKEEKTLKDKKNELEDKGITYSAFTTYDDGESYDLKVITNAIDPSFNHCAFDEYKNNTLTKEYCSLKSKLKKLESTNVEFDKKFNNSNIIPYFMFGGFIIITGLMISCGIYMITKRREITAFSVQQVMPVAQEGIEKMTPTMAKVAEDMSPTMKNVAKDMAPVYGEIAKEITKGIKEGKKDE